MNETLQDYKRLILRTHFNILIFQFDSCIACLMVLATGLVAKRGVLPPTLSTHEWTIWSCYWHMGKHRNLHREFYVGHWKLWLRAFSYGILKAINQSTNQSSKHVGKHDKSLMMFNSMMFHAVWWCLMFLKRQDYTQLQRLCLTTW